MKQQQSLYDPLKTAPSKLSLGTGLKTDRGSGGVQVLAKLLKFQDTSLDHMMHRKHRNQRLLFWMVSEGYF